MRFDFSIVFGGVSKLRKLGGHVSLSKGQYGTQGNKCNHCKYDKYEKRSESTNTRVW